MITYAIVERFAKSPVKITIAITAVVIALSYNTVRLEDKLNRVEGNCERNFAAEKKAFREDLRISDSLLNACQTQSRIEADKAVKRAVKEAEDYRKLYVKMVELKIESQTNRK